MTSNAELGDVAITTKGMAEQNNTMAFPSESVHEGSRHSGDTMDVVVLEESGTSERRYPPRRAAQHFLVACHMRELTPSSQKA